MCSTEFGINVRTWLVLLVLLVFPLEAGIDGVQLVHLTRQGLLGLGVDKEEHIKCLSPA